MQDAGNLVCMMQITAKAGRGLRCFSSCQNRWSAPARARVLRLPAWHGGFRSAKTWRRQLSRRCSMSLASHCDPCIQDYIPLFLAASVICPRPSQVQNRGPSKFSILQPRGCNPAGKLSCLLAVQAGMQVYSETKLKRTCLALYSCRCWFIKPPM